MQLPLITLVALPFVGSLIAALLPTNARNAESTLGSVPFYVAWCLCGTVSLDAPPTHLNR